MGRIWFFLLFLSSMPEYGIGGPCEPHGSIVGDCCYPNTEFMQNVRSLGYDCIYGSLVERNWRQRWLGDLQKNATVGTSAEKKSFLFDNPPSRKSETGGGGSSVEVTVSNGAIREIVVDEEKQTFALLGHYVLTWFDNRLTWDNSVSKKPVFRADEWNRVWEPSLLWLAALNNPGYHPFRRAVVSRNGQVTAFMDFHTLDSCFFDYTYFPYDEHACCSEFSLSNDDTATLRNLPRNFSFLGGKLSRLWTVVDIETHQNEDQQFTDGGVGGGVYNKLRQTMTFSLCVTLKRQSASAANEFILPLAVSTLLVVVVPFFASSWIVQVLALCFCLCLQYGCLFTLVLETEQLQFGSTTPRLLRYYDFVIWTTAFNLVVTMFLWSMSRRSISAAPPAKLAKFSEMINKRLSWCLSEGDKENDASESVAGGVVGDSGSGRNERGWRLVWRAVNTMMKFLFALIYLIGLCVIIS